MSATIENSTDSILTVKITGTLAQPELAVVQGQVSEFIQKQKEKARILVVTENFQGWARGGDWGDLSFQVDNDDRIEKMAIVGEKKWQELALIFAAKGVRRFPIEYFQPAEMTKARDWLET